MNLYMEENPIMDYYNPYFDNPRRRKKSYRRNPVSLGAITKKDTWMDVVWGVGGFAAANMIPPLIVKTATTTTQKIMKLALSVGIAVVSGMLVHNFNKKDAGASKAVMMGGLIGATASAVSTFTQYNISKPVAQLGMPVAQVRRYPAPATQDQFKSIKLT